MDPRADEDRPPRHARIRSVAAYRPRRAVSNRELVAAGGLSTSDAWIRQRTGIRSRGIAGSRETLAYMGARAGRLAVTRAGLAAGEIDCVLAATMSHLDAGTSLARAIADRLPGRPRAAMDVNAACAGFCTGLELARCLISGRVYRRVLLVGAERMSDIVDPGDRTTGAIFADGAGAAVIAAADEPGVGVAAWGSSGEGQELLMRAAGPPGRAGAGGRPAYLRMQGPELYRWVMANVPEVARTAARRAGVGLDELRAFIPHQANDRMITGLSVALGLPDSVVVARDVIRSGNTSAASVPLAMDGLLAQHPELSGELALLVGFGAGVSYAGQVVRLP
ncbi:beta-ketoacyl-ACP synthase 3 [Streptomyces monticola]|uniref:Beta-ketoacyl-ACP synthase 3 n=1 Tax=Streptomyces monticola TaxID=2666263 RepID=A0ABW2JXU8_9ACTN